jgi:hypothetical protein
VPTRESRFSGPGSANQRDQCQFGNFDCSHRSLALLFRENTAICEGAP